MYRLRSRVPQPAVQHQRQMLLQTRASVETSVTAARQTSTTSQHWYVPSLTASLRHQRPLASVDVFSAFLLPSLSREGYVSLSDCYQVNVGCAASSLCLTCDLSFSVTLMRVQQVWFGL